MNFLCLFLKNVILNNKISKIVILNNIFFVILNLFQHLIKPSREKIVHGCICAIFFSLPIAEQENPTAKQAGKPLGQCRKLNRKLSFGYAESGGGILYS